MADLDKVLKGLECCQNQTDRGITCECISCPYEQGYQSKCRVLLKQDALEVLKSQQAEIAELKTKNEELFSRWLHKGR